MKTALRITVDVVITIVALLIVAVAVGVFGVVAEGEKAARRWPILK